MSTEDESLSQVFIDKTSEQKYVYCIFMFCTSLDKWIHFLNKIHCIIYDIIDIFRDGDTFIIKGTSIQSSASMSRVNELSLGIDNSNDSDIKQTNINELQTITINRSSSHGSYGNNTSKIEGRKIHGGNGLKSPINIDKFIVPKKKQPGLRANVFVSKECTQLLAEYIVDEYWGKEQGMLYKYLDYIFRCQIFDNQVKKITYKLSENNTQDILIFHTGLQRRTDIEFLYLILVENDADKRHAEQKWYVYD